MRGSLSTYNKNPLTVGEQVDLLIERGLHIENRSDIEGYLENISYYHFSSYFKSFQKKVDVFDSGVNFETILNAYTFDKKLRLLMLDVLERIEKTFKCRIINEISLLQEDAFWHTNSNFFMSEEIFQTRILPHLQNTLTLNEKEYENYREKYNSPIHPPAWIFFEPLTFGGVVSVYRNLTKKNRKAISRTFDLSPDDLVSWMYGMSAIRNISAHHARLWNKKMVANIRMKNPKYKSLFNTEEPNRIYNYIVVMHILMCKVNPTSQWLEKMCKLISDHEIRGGFMGFPENWRENLDKIVEIEKCSK